MSRPNGVVLWEGPSPIDGSPIAVIMTGIVRPSDNVKTGDMIQTWILRTDTTPVEAVKTGADASICGDCPLRGILGQKRACYVNVGQAPGAIYRAYHRGAYPTLDWATLPLVLDGRAVRFGAYGDPSYGSAGALGSTRRGCIDVDGIHSPVADTVGAMGPMDDGIHG